MRREQNAIHFTPDIPGRSAEKPELSLRAVRELYDYPAEITSPWVRANFVCSIDGAVSIGGASGALGTPADHQVFGILRELADVVVVGAGTVRAENYGGARISTEGRRRRLHAGMSEVPPIAVVSARADLDPDSRLFTDTEVPPIILTCAEADPARLARLASAGASIVEAGERQVTSEGLINVLAERTLNRVLCEGGPGLFGQLVADDAVDELCITTAPVLLGGSAGRISVSPRVNTIGMTPAHILSDTDGTVLTRWVRTTRP